MNTKINYVDEIVKLLTTNGVGVRKHASTIASILGIQYNSAKQKLDGKRGVTLDEIKAVFKFFGETFSGKRNHNCVFIINNIHKRCNIEVSDNEGDEQLPDEQYAIKRDGIYIIDVSGKVQPQDVLYRVTSIDFLPPPRLAILDNDEDILALLKKLCQKYGMESEVFTTKESLLMDLEHNSYDGYILDWLLDYGRTSQEVIKTVRNAGSTSPVIILTGELNHYEQNISHMIIHHNVYVIEKPARSLIIASFLISNIFFI